jgi:TusA-related sulfurtransferase
MMDSASHPIADNKPLDLRTTKCPLNFVKAKLALEKLPVGGVLEIWILADSQSALNIPQSIQQEGHKIVDDQIEEDGLRRLWIQRF